jgi:hypothetical protein
MYEGAFVEKDNVAKSGEAAGCTFFLMSLALFIMRCKLTG